MASCTWWKPTTSNPSRSGARTRARLRRRAGRDGPWTGDAADHGPPGERQEAQGDQVAQTNDDGRDHADESCPGLLPGACEARCGGALRPGDGRADLADPHVDRAVRGLVVEDAERPADLLDAELHLLQLGLDAQRVGDRR